MNYVHQSQDKTVQNERIQGLDLLRAIAITMVMLIHGAKLGKDNIKSLEYVLFYGWTGVDLFFVLSGYLIAGQIFSTKDSGSLFQKIKLFWFKRWTRTVPLYYVVLFFYIVVKPMLGFKFNATIWPYFFFLQNYIDIGDFVQTWSLCIEEQFYLVFPLVYFIFFKKNRWPIFWLSLVFLSYAYRLKSGYQLDWNFISRKDLAHTIEFLPIGHFDGIAMGIFLASTESHWSHFAHKFKMVLWGAGTVLFIWACSTVDPYFPNGHYAAHVYLLVSLAFSMFLMAACTTSINESLYRVIKPIALYSYGIYLWNSLIERFMARYTVNLHWILAVIIFWILTLSISKATYYLIELPVIKWRNRLIV